MQSMTFRFILFLLLCLSLLPIIQSKLNTKYYEKSCPQFSKIIRETVTEKQLASPTAAAATIRLLFHDCMLEGCDGSVLISSTAFNKAERDADINLSLPGDGFAVVSRAKTAFELQCPGIVSCADILAAAARDLIVILGGPFFEVRLGRKDGLVSKAEHVKNKYPLPTMPLSKIISIFASKGFSIQEMVALAGAHTVGFAHCKEFSHRIYNFDKNSDYDPAYNHHYAQGLRKLCANYTKDSTMSAYNDVITPSKFDNMYYKNLKRGLGLLASDQALLMDKRTKLYVDAYAANETKFFHDFAQAMQKVSILDVKTGGKGEVRRRCDSFNSIF